MDVFHLLLRVIYLIDGILNLIDLSVGMRLLSCSHFALPPSNLGAELRAAARIS